MRGPTYSEADLFALKDSPLVKKPDGLPSISQWMDVPADQTANNGHTNNNGTVRRARGVRDGEGAATNEQRPMVNPMGQFGRRQSMQPGEETVLGPPKLAFLSARATTKPTGDAKERTGITSTDGDNVGDRFPKNERWTRDRETDRARDKGYTNGRRNGREDGEAGWQNVKGRKSLGQEDFERFTGRNGDRTREKHEGDLEPDVAPRRGNRERNEPRWGRREEGKEETTKPGVQGGWRDRDRERENGRDWTRGGGTRAEEDPEWMETKVEKKEFKPRTQEDFQRWKEQMRAKDTPAEDRDEPREAPPELSTATSITAPPMFTAPLHTPTTEPTQAILFGNWGRDKSEDIAPAEPMSAKPRTEKKSRFMNMFAKPEEPAAQSQPPAPMPAPPAPAPEANADKEGFQRILQMLGQVGAPPPQQSMPAPTNGARHGGGVSLEFHQQSPPPEPQHGRPPPRTLEQQSLLDNILAPRPAVAESRSSQQSRFASMSPDNGLPDQFRLPRPEPNQPNDVFSHQPGPPRNNPQDANLAAILNSRAREEAQRDDATKKRERDFLLNLMQQPTRATPPQNQNLPRPVQENHNMAFFEQHRQQPQQLQQQQQPKVRGGFPPVLMDDPRMYAENEMMRRDDRREQLELRQIQQIQQQQEALRAKNQRMPMVYPNEDPLMGLQRRNTGGDPRMPTNMGIPSQPVPDMLYMGGRVQQGMPPTPQERANIAPPPGFGGPMRQPPGLGGPNSQQMGPGGPSFSAGNTPLGLPPGFPPGGSIRGLGGFPGGPGGPAGNGMQGPPGYFPPPGYGGPPMPGMRGGGEDPRMMFDAQFGGPPRQQPGRGPPPNMY